MKSSPLRNRLFQGLCGAQFASLMATYAIYFASMALVEEITRSSAKMGLMIFSSTLPGLLFGLLAGVVVDRRGKRRILIASNALRVLVALLFLAAVRFFPPTYLLLAVYLSNFCLSALVQFVISAESALIPQFVTNDNLMMANSFFNLSSLAAQGFGLILLAPLLIKLGGCQAVGLTSAILYLVGLILLIPLPREEATRRRGRTLAELWADLQEGWQFIASDRPVLLATLQLTLILSVGLMLSTLAPGFLVRVLGLELADAVYVAAPFGLGFGLGMLLVGRYGKLLSKERWINVGFLALSIALVIMPFLQCVYGAFLLLSLEVAFGLGLGFALVMVPAKTILQERPPEHMRGRVISTQLVLGNAASTLPMPLSGGLADLIGIRKVILLVALIALGASVVSIRHTHS